MKKVLFVCSQNKLRSPTAEEIFRDTPGFKVRSAGMNNDAEVPISPELVEWTDYIFVMEKSHRNKLQKKYKKHLNKQKVICLNIPDDYEYMEQSLINLLRNKLGTFFNN